jgi:hypothetical protein
LVAIDIIIKIATIIKIAMEKGFSELSNEKILARIISKKKMKIPDLKPKYPSRINTFKVPMKRI